MTNPSTARRAYLPAWSIAAPFASWMLLAGKLLAPGPAYAFALAAGLLAGVIAAVHHAELVAHRVGEPVGSLVLAGAVTAIEVALIVSIMIGNGPGATTVARDAVFAAVMIILNGIVGACLVVGGMRHGEQRFGHLGVNAALATLAAIVVLTLVLPNYTTTVPGPHYSPRQLGFVAVVSLALYATFLLVQTVRHREYFLAPGPPGPTETHAAPPSAGITSAAVFLLLACLAAVVLIAKALSPAVEAGVERAGAPPAVVGVVIATIVLMPEGWASLRAARADRLQTSLNLALGSALASIGLTIPAVAAVSIASGMTLALGIDGKSTVLLALTLLVCALSLGAGRTTVLQGAVHLFIFSVYVLTTVVP